MRGKKIKVLILQILIVVSVLGFFTISANAVNQITLTLAGTTGTVSTNVFAANPNVRVLDVIATVDKSITNPVYEVNVPKYLGINKYTLPSNSNGKLQKVQMIDKATGAVMASDNVLKDRKVRFTLTPGQYGPIGFNVEITAQGYYVLPSETFILYADYFNGTTKLATSNNFTLNATNHTYNVAVELGRGDLEKGKLAQYRIKVLSGGSYPWASYLTNAEVKVPLPAGAVYVSGDSGVQYVAASGGQPAYLSIKNWGTQIPWEGYRNFIIKYPSAMAGQTYTGASMVLTYMHGTRQLKTITQTKGIYNTILQSKGRVTDVRMKSFIYKIGANNSPFAEIDFINNQDIDLKNVNYDISFSPELRVKGLNIVETHLDSKTYANITFTTSFGNKITKKVDLDDMNITPDILGLSGGEWITNINVLVPTLPSGFSLYQVYGDHYRGLVPYGTTDSLVTDGTIASITLEEHSDQQLTPIKSVSNPKLYKDVPAQIGVTWDTSVQSVEVGKKITLDRPFGASDYPYNGTAYHTIVNPTFYYTIPSGFTVKPSEVIFGGPLINKKPNITWNPGIIAPNPSDPYFPNGAGVLKIEFDGLTPESSATLQGIDDNGNLLDEDVTIQLPTQVLENTQIGDYPFKPFIFMEAQNTKVSAGWGADKIKDIYDINGNNDRNETLTYTNLVGVGYANYYVTVTDPLKIDVKSTISSRITGVDSMVQFYPNDLGTYTIDLRNRLNTTTTNTAIYIPIPQANANITDNAGENYTQQWTTQLQNIAYTQIADPGYEPTGVEIWYSTSNAATKNELSGSTDSGYVKYTGGILPADIKMVKLKVAQLPKTSSIKFDLGIKAQNVPQNTGTLSYMIADYKFIYDGVETKGKTNTKTLELIPYKVSGKVFEDINKNSCFDSGEPPLKDISVKLFDNNGTVVQNVNSSADGTYQFIIDKEGTYTIQAYKGETGVSFTTSSSSTQASKVDGNGQYSFTIDQNATKTLENVHIGYIISWNMTTNPITVALNETKHVIIEKSPFKPLLRNGEIVSTEDPSIAFAQWDDSTQEPFDIIVSGYKLGLTYLIIRYPNGDTISETKVPVTVTTKSLEVPANTFTDRITAKNNWIKDEDGEAKNKQYNWYFAKGDEIVTRVRFKDTESVGYDTVIIDYDLNSDSNNEMLIQSPQIVDIREAGSGAKFANYSGSSINTTKYRVTINTPPVNKELFIYLKYKIKMKNPQHKLNNPVLNNKVDITMYKGVNKDEIKDIGIMWPLQLSDTKIRFR